MSETVDLDELERLARAALQFLDWAAGEGICPTEEGVPSPDVPLFEFASKTGNEDYASYPDVISGVFGRLREAEAQAYAAADLTWFWEIVDRDGLNNVASDERKALSELVRYAADRDALRNAIADLKAELAEAVGVIQRWVSWCDDWHAGKPHPSDDLAAARAFLAKHGGRDG